MATAATAPALQRRITTPNSGITTGPRPPAPVCIAPIHYAGHDAIKNDIANFKAALNAAGVEEGFMTSVAPGSASRIANAYYKTEEEFLYACAEAMREEYKAILDAGLILQLDDPAIARIGTWSTRSRPSTNTRNSRWFGSRRSTTHCAACPQDRIRYHFCWGSWHGPHMTDIAMRDIVDVMLAINVRAYSFEAGNVRHEHEWKVWQDVKLPDGKLILPGVVSHATNVVEHPELVAERICALPSWSAASASSPRPIAASAAASIRRSPGPSSSVWSRAPRSPPANCGAETDNTRCAR